MFAKFGKFINNGKSMDKRGKKEVFFFSIF